MKKLLFLIILIFASQANAEIIKITSLSELEEQFRLSQKQYTPEKILGIFAVDGVLLDTSDSELKINDEYRPLVRRALARVKPGSNLTYINEVLLTSYKHRLVSGDLPRLVKEIKAGGTTVIAISNTVSGNFNQIPRLEVWLAEYLAKFDLEFGGSIFNKQDFSVKDSEKAGRSVRAVFYNGVLSTGEHKEGNSKHRALANLLVTVNFMPDVIIAVDSDLSSLQGMEEQIAALSNGNTTFIGFNYQPPNSGEREVDANKVVKFWSGVAGSLSAVKRKIKNQEAENPYEE